MCEFFRAQSPLEQTIIDILYKSSSSSECQCEVVETRISKDLRKVVNNNITYQVSTF